MGSINTNFCNSISLVKEKFREMQAYLYTNGKSRRSDECA